MDLNPLAIAKSVSRIIKNREKYEQMAKELDAKVVIGSAPGVQARLAMKTGRFVSIDAEPGANAEAVRHAVNAALDQADALWASCAAGNDL